MTRAGTIPLSEIEWVKIYFNSKRLRSTTKNLKRMLTETKIEELTREVREHNNFARRVPVVEEQIKVINHRIEDLEDANKA